MRMRFSCALAHIIGFARAIHIAPGQWLSGGPPTPTKPVNAAELGAEVQRGGTIVRPRAVVSQFDRSRISAARGGLVLAHGSAQARPAQRAGRFRLFGAGAHRLPLLEACGVDLVAAWQPHHHVAQLHFTQADRTLKHERWCAAVVRVSGIGDSTLALVIALTLLQLQLLGFERLDDAGGQRLAWELPDLDDWLSPWRLAVLACNGLLLQ
eukprot:scaffold59207_cov66-Phaeocystis_antarctica.AAC.4